jgi:Fe-S cluster assembly protein SufD
VSPSAEHITGVGKDALDALVAGGTGSIPERQRYDALARFAELPMRRVHGRYWKHDLAALDLSRVQVLGEVRTVPVERDDLRARKIAVEDFSVARARMPAEFEAAFGQAVDVRRDPFASLALAFQNAGTFVFVPAGVQLDEPIVIEYRTGSNAVFPYTLVSVGAGSRVTIVERISGSSDAGASAFACGITEIVAAPEAQVGYVVDQRTPPGTTAVFARGARLDRNATLDIAAAELGAEATTGRISVNAAAAGARTGVTAFFFSNGDQHVDLETEVVHGEGNTRSETVVRSAGTDRGQGRYLGNIKILAHAHGADASLRDDALLLSEGAHIDSIPALEIAANDVKAYHGATVGAISEDELFYAQSRGIARREAERMIALGFFEPAIARFPGETLRAELRELLEAKLGSQP